MLSSLEIWLKSGSGESTKGAVDEVAFITFFNESHFVGTYWSKDILDEFLKFLFLDLKPCQKYSCFSFRLCILYFPFFLCLEKFMIRFHSLINLQNS